MTASRRVLIRADASLDIGSGHVMRCLSLAQALRERGGEVHFACRDLPGHLFEAIHAQNFPLHALPAPAGAKVQVRPDIVHAAWLGVDELRDARDTRQVLDRIGACEVLLVDHYALDAAWQRSICASATRLAVIDDLADRDHVADLLIDPNLMPDEYDRYARRIPTGCGRLVGPAYAPLRLEFLDARKQVVIRRGTLERVLIFLGGVDAAGYTEVAIEALNLLRQRPKVEVVVGSGNSRHAAIAARCAELGFAFARNVSDMAMRMAQADLSIGAGGSTTWERACLGLPSLILVAANNQRSGATAMQQAGCAIVLEAAQAKPQTIANLLLSLQSAPDRLRDMSARNADMVDGRGAARIARNLLPPPLALRRATESDREALFEWRNHPEVRAQSNSTAPIAREGHDVWFSGRQADPGCALLVAECEGKPEGILRYDTVNAEESLVSIYLVPGRGGQGLGAEILRAGTRWLRVQGVRAARIRAEVSAQNIASQRAFREAGYCGGPTVFTLPL